PGGPDPGRRARRRARHPLPRRHPPGTAGPTQLAAAQHRHQPPAVVARRPDADRLGRHRPPAQPGWHAGPGRALIPSTPSTEPPRMTWTASTERRQRAQASIGHGVASIDTPSLVIDLDAMERNLTRMAAFASE